MTKISQYTAITTLASGDLLDISQDAGGGSFGGTSAVLVNESVVSGDDGEDDVLSPGHLAIITLNDGATKVPGFKFTES